MNQSHSASEGNMPDGAALAVNEGFWLQLETLLAFLDSTLVFLL